MEVIDSPIPLVDLRIQHERLQHELSLAITECITQSQFRKGPVHDRFAEEFGEFCGGGHVVPCGNGTDAIYIALMTLLGKGDGESEVITAANTFFATVEAIVHAGYRPVLVDIDPKTYLMDVTKVESAITRRTVAIVPVHLYGQMVPMDRIVDIAEAHKLSVVEDAAQSHGALWKGRAPGQWGDAACYSFYPAKNLGALGDGGAVFTRDGEHAERMLRFADHGTLLGGVHSVIGVNSRLDGLQAAVLRVKLPHLSAWNEARREAARLYDKMLEDVPGVITPHVMPEASHVFHLYVVQVERRDAVLQYLKDRNIGAAIHYSPPLHMHPALAQFQINSQNLPITRQICENILSLPLYPEIRTSQISRVCLYLNEALSPHSSVHVA